MTKSKKFGATLIATLMVVSIVGAFAPGIGTASAGGPPGMVGVPGDNVGPPEHAGGPGGPPDHANIPTHAAAWDIHSSAHAGDLEVDVIETDHDDLQLVLRDEINHDGREIAVSRETLEDAVGHEPSAAFGVHESGDEWTSDIVYDGSHAIFEVPKFSENEVTFSGSVSLSGDEATDGTQFEYNLETTAGVDNFDIELEGQRATNEMLVDEKLVDGETLSTNVGGTTEPDDSTVSLTGVEEQTDANDSVALGDNETHDLEIGGNVDPTESKITAETVSGSDGSGSIGSIGSESGDRDTLFLEDVTGDLDEVELNWGADWSRTDRDRSASISMYVAAGDVGDDVFETDSIASDSVSRDSTSASQSTGTRTSGSRSLATDEGVTVGVRISSADNVDSVSGDSGDDTDVHMDETTLDVDVSSNSDTVSFDGGGSESIDLEAGTETLDVTGDGFGTFDFEWVERSVSEDPAIDHNGETIIEHTGILEDGETVSEPIDLSTGDEQIAVSTASGSSTLATLEYVEVSETIDPEISVNGETTSFDGVLEEGETTTLETNTDWIEEGKNEVEILMHTPDAGPSPQVGFDYVHNADAATVLAEVDATTWSENYNVSNSWPSEHDNAEITIPFAGDVVEIANLDKRVNGGEWESLDSDEYELEGTTLTAQLGDVEADTTIDVRASGSKVATTAGEIEVIEPTLEGNELETKVEISEINDPDKFGIDVGGTVVGEDLHYSSQYSWAGEPIHVEVTSGGDQTIRAPDAPAGGTMTIERIPLELEPNSGMTEAQVEDPNTPRFALGTGNSSASQVDVIWRDTTAGDRYVLWDVINGWEVDADRASSPVTLTVSGDSPGTYEILQIDADSDDDGGAPLGSGMSAAPLVMVIPAVGLSVGAMWYAGRRAGATGARDSALLLVGSVGVLFVAIELVTPGSLSSDLAVAVTRLLTSGVGAMVIALAALVALWQVDQRTDAEIPSWLMVMGTTLTAVVATEAIRPGAVLDPVSSVLMEIGALLTLILIGWAIYRWRARQQERQADAATPDTQVTLDLGGEDD